MLEVRIPSPELDVNTNLLNTARMLFSSYFGTPQNLACNLLSRSKACIVAVLSNESVLSTNWPKRCGRTSVLKHSKIIFGQDYCHFFKNLLLILKK